MESIKGIRAREILDSRGNPTVEAEVITSNGVMGRSSVPSGASTGSREACELRDHDSRYQGRGCHRAIAAIHDEIRPALLGFNICEQTAIDECLIHLDGTPQKQRLGANAILAISQACLRAAATGKGLPIYQYLNPESIQLPVPLFNLINGGAHADNVLDIQEFMVMPARAPSFKLALSQGVEVFQALKSLLKKQSYSTAVGDEGGFAPDVPSNEAALELLLQAIELAGFIPGQDMYIALDVASTEFYQEGCYHLSSESKAYRSAEFVGYLKNLTQQYPIYSIEDGMSEDDWPGWKLLTEELDKHQLVGDDVFVTNTHLLVQGIQEGLANAILIKPNQIGTLTETFTTIRTAQTAGYHPILSHRSGETEDTLIADLAVACQVGQIKAGSLCRGERIAKYNQLLRIEEELGHRAQYASLPSYHTIL